MTRRTGRPPGDLLADVVPSRSEITLVKRAVQHLRDLPRCWARKTHGSQFAQAGEPDIDGCLRGRSLKIEVKMPGAVPTAVQFAAMRRWERSGALTGWVTSMRELDRLLDHADDTDWVNPQLCRHEQYGTEEVFVPSENGGSMQPCCLRCWAVV